MTRSMLPGLLLRTTINTGLVLHRKVLLPRAEVVLLGVLLVLGFLPGATPAMQPAAKTAPEAPYVFLEAEGFVNLGGWSIDQQAMDVMGSPYVLAHGLGAPVADATTSVEVPADGTYRVWVRTRDWVASWNVPGAPGRFQLLADGRPLPTTFGAEGADWHWQDGGTMVLKAKQSLRLALHDLTGFDGRCDAILLCADAQFTPPTDRAALAEFRRKALRLPAEAEDAGTFDLVVVGGGMAGTCAAVSAARLGVTVALVQDRPVLGGNNSSEVRVGLAGNIHQKPYANLGNLVEEIGPIGYYDYMQAKKNPDSPKSKQILAMDPVKKIHNAGPASNYQDDKKLQAVQAEKNIRLFLCTHVVRAQKKGARIAAVVGRDIRTGKEIRLAGKLFVDCTGDGALGALAGADFRIGRESKSETSESLAPDQPDRLSMGTSVQWYSEKQTSPVAFPECPWAMAFSEQTCHKLTRGDWDWETGMNQDQLTEIEQIRDHALRVTLGNWAYLKNHCREKEKFANEKLTWVAYIGGKRESRRLLGDVILCQQDVQERREYPDASVTTTWGIDLHYPAPENTKHFPGQEFRSIAKIVPVKPYAIPYRCLYSRNVRNLFMAGRDISVTHVALGTIRVQKTTGMMGEVVGMAASLCVRHSTDPRGVYQNHLRELKGLMEKGITQRTGVSESGAAKAVEAKPAAGKAQTWAPSPTDKVVKISGIYPHLTVFNVDGECGMGAVVPWADKLWMVTYPPHGPTHTHDKLYCIDKTLKMEIRPESVGGTHANRLVHRESNQLFIGPYAIDAQGAVRAIDRKQLVGRMTATARHLTDPANKVYYFDMEGAIYEVDVHTLAVTRLFEKPVAGWHGKGAYTAQGRLVIANNGESVVHKKKYDFLAGAVAAGPEDSGILAEWNGATWRMIERHQFTEVTGPGGIFGSPDDKSPLWAMGWDKRSVVLRLLDGGQWYTFRLPKASYTQEAYHGHYTEWPRIREVTDGRLLAHMNCLFYEFPKTFSKDNYGGLKPISTYTRMPVDYCAWQGQIVMARDDASVMLGNEIAGQSHSAFWFGSWSDLENLGAPIAWGGPWQDDTVRAGDVSDPFLVHGFCEGVLHLKHNSATPVRFVIEADVHGRGQWEPVAAVCVPAKGYAFRILREELRAQWVRLRAEQESVATTAFFRLGNPGRSACPQRFAALADVGYQEPVIEGVVKPAAKDARNLLLAANRAEDSSVKEKTNWSMDGRLEFQPLDQQNRIDEIRGTKITLPEKPGYDVDAASVIVTSGKKRYRLPKTDAKYDGPVASGWPRGLREIVTERHHFNAHGTIYEVPLGDAGGFQRMRPVCTHGKRIVDFASWRGMLVLTGVRADVQADEHCYKSADGRAAVWFGDVDDLWRMGAPVGVGGPWKDSSVAANQPSDPYLMAGYRTKSVALSHNGAEPVTFTIEVDFVGGGPWSAYSTITVQPGKPVTHTFPAGYSAHWVRLTADRAATATATFTYQP